MIVSLIGGSVAALVVVLLTDLAVFYGFLES